LSTADAVARETAWLTSSGDGLPALLTSAGGPWDIIQAYMPRTPAQQKTQLYVMRRGFQTARFSNARRLPTYRFHLSAIWPIGATTTGPGIAEAEQAALDAALALLDERIEGFPNDKTHGDRFLSVAEAPAPSVIAVEISDPAQATSTGYLSAAITYSADDEDYTA
jgi:hypothetical protein